MKKIIIPIVLIFLFSFNAFAVSEKDILDFAETEKLISALPDEIEKSEAEEFLNSGDTENLKNSFFDLGFDGIKTSLISSIKSFSVICAILIISGIVSSVSGEFNISSKAFDLIVVGILTLVFLKLTDSAINICCTAMKMSADFMLTSLPVLTLIWTMSGNATAAASNGAFLIFAIEFIETVLVKIVLPLTRIMFIFAPISVFLNENIASLSSFIKKTVKVLIVFLFTVLSSVLFFNTQIVGTKDSLAIRGVRFAAGNFIPVVGSYVGEASKSVINLLGFVKTKCGILAVFGILVNVSIPIISIFINKVFIMFSSGVASLVGIKQGSKLIGEISSVFDLLLAEIISSSIFFIIFLALFTKTTVVGA